MPVPRPRLLAPELHVARAVEAAAPGGGFAAGAGLGPAVVAGGDGEVHGFGALELESDLGRAGVEAVVEAAVVQEEGLHGETAAEVGAERDQVGRAADGRAGAVGAADAGAGGVVGAVAGFAGL